MAADAKFGPGAGDAFKQALDTLKGSGDSRFADAGTKLETAIKSGDLSSIQSAAQALEGLVKDKVASPEQAGGLARAIAVLKAKLGVAQATGQTDSFDSSSTSTSSSSSSSSSSGTSASASSGTVNTEALFGGAGNAALNAARGLLGSNPGYGNAGMALSYVLDNLASKSKDGLTDTDKGAIKQAIIQMQSLVAAHAVNPAQAGVLNNAIWGLQGALT